MTSISTSADALTLEKPIFKLASVENSRQALLPAIERLTLAEQARVLRFVRQSDRERFMLGRILVRSMLDDVFGIKNHRCDFVADTYGKPYLRDRPDIAFNIAHSGDLVLVGMGCGIQLGVDLEMHRGDIEYDGISRLIFTAPEWAVALGGSPARRTVLFFRQWALKEALAKALGTGLSLEPRRFAIDQTATPLDVTFVGDGEDDVGQGWIITDIEVGEGYSAAAAWRRLDMTDCDRMSA